MTTTAGPFHVTVLEHDAEAPAGWLGDTLARAGATIRTVRLYASEAPPDDLRPAGPLVVLGGVMGAYEEQAYPVLVQVKELLRIAHAAQIPVLGICLGAQLAADALGGRAFLGDGPEYGYVPVELTAEGRRDPVLGRLEGDVLSWHQDTFDLPPAATLLARSDRYPQAFRLGRTLGLQFHPETPPDLVDTWVESTGPELVRAAGYQPEAIQAQAHARHQESARVADDLFAAWIEEARRQR